MLLPPLVHGRILRRYKRFLADVELNGGEVVTAHVPNTGTMESCWAPGVPVELSVSDNTRRKLPYTLERVDMGTGWIGVNTVRVNAVVAEGIAAGRIAPLNGYTEIRREPVFQNDLAPRSRFDLRLSGDGRPVCVVEIKNATLYRDGVVQFPDAVTVRGRKHLDLLARALESGYRACLVFAINRSESGSFRPAAEIDPAYADRLTEVARIGVEVILVRIVHRPQAIDAVQGRRWRPTRARR